MTMCDKELLVSYLYDELQGPERKALQHHLVSCRDCQQEVQGLRATRSHLESWSVPEPALGLRLSDAAAAPRSRFRLVPAWGLAAAAVLVLAVAGSWFALKGGNGAPISTPTVNETAPQVASLDLRPLAVTRSEEQKSTGPLEVPRGRVNATILLPVGSSPGVYEVRILDRDLRVRASTTGSAEIRNYITTLEATLDTSGLDVGDYQLTLRREGGEWQMFPLRVR